MKEHLIPVQAEIYKQVDIDHKSAHLAKLTELFGLDFVQALLKYLVREQHENPRTTRTTSH